MPQQILLPRGSLRSADEASNISIFPNGDSSHNSRLTLGRGRKMGAFLPHRPFRLLTNLHCKHTNRYDFALVPRLTLHELLETEERFSGYAATACVFTHSISSPTKMIHGKYGTLRSHEDRSLRLH